MEVTEGIEPSVEYARDLLTMHSQRTINVSTFAARRDIQRKKFQLLISQNLHVENEAKRLMTMGRSAEDLENIYKNIEVSVQKEIEIFALKVAEDIASLEKDIDNDLLERLSVERSFENDIIALKSEYVDGISCLDDENRELFVCEKSNLFTKYLDDMCEACKRAVSRTSALQRVADELHTQTQFEQQKCEALQYIVEKALESNFLSLMKTQQSRRNLGTALINEYEKDLKGLENILAEKKFRQTEFLHDRLNKRKALRESELLKSTGLTAVEISKIVEEEYEHDLEAGESDILTRLDEEKDLELKGLEEKAKVDLDELNELGSVVTEFTIAQGFASVTDKALEELSLQADNRNDSMLKQALEKEMRAMRSSYDVESRRLEDSLISSQAKEKALLKSQLEARRKKREAELLASGLSERKAEQQASNEHKEELSKAMDAVDERTQKQIEDLQVTLQNQLKAEEAEILEKFSRGEAADITPELLATSKQNFMKDKISFLEDIRMSTLDHLKSEQENDVHRLELAHLASLESLNQELAYSREQGKVRIEQKLKALRDRRKSELVAEGFSESDAAAQAEVEASNEFNAEMAAIDLAESEAKAKLERKFEGLFESLREQYEKSMDIFVNGIEAHVQNSTAAILEDLESKKLLMMRKLIEEGMPESDADRVVRSQFESDFAAAKARDENLMSLASTKLNDLLSDNFESKSRAIRMEHEKKLIGLSAAQNKAKDEAVSSLRDRLEKRKNRRVEGLVRMGINDTEAARIAEVEFEDTEDQISEFEKHYSQQLAENLNGTADALAKRREDFAGQLATLEEREDSEASNLFEQVIQTERELAARFEETAAANSGALLQASKEVQELAEKDIQEWRQKYEADCQRLEDELLTSKLKEKSLLKSQLENRRKKREAELRDRGVAEKDAERLAAEEHVEEDARLLKEFDARVEAEASSLKQKLKEEGDEEMKQIIQKKYDEASLAALEANFERQAAHQKLDSLRQQQKEEAQKLEDGMAASRKANELKLKSRLAEKRAAAVRDLEAQKVSSEEKQRMLQQLEEEEHKSMMELLKQREVEEDAARREQEEEHRVLLIQLEKDAKEKELEAIAQAAKESALLSMKDLQNRADEEKNSKNLQRLRDQYAKEEERLKLEAESQKSQGRGKLAERLAQKRQQREKELAEKEAKALADLASKHAAEASERDAKLVWTERLRICMEEAASLGFADAEFEDYCMQNVVAKGMVPQKQLYDAVERVLNPRHSREMTGLLKGNFDERIQALKFAVQKLLEDKAVSRMKLIEVLNSEGADDVTVLQRLAELDAEYSSKQAAVEQQVTSSLEPIHMQQQISTRQQQLQDVSRLISLYSDPEALLKLQESSKTQADELEEYRQRVEKEKKAREDKLALERKEIEERLRQQHEAEVRRLQEQLRAEVAKTEASFETEKRALMERKELMEKQQATEKGDLDNQEKERILLDFEREHTAALLALEKEKNDQKKKLQERLAAKRQIKATRVVPPPAAPVKERRMSQITQMWNNLSKRRTSIKGLNKDDDVSSAAASVAASFAQSAAASATAERRASLASLGKNLKAAVTVAAASVTQSAYNPGFNAALAQIEAKIEVKLDRIEKLINAISTSKTDVRVGAGDAALAASYQDDNEPQPGDSLVVVSDEINDLAVQESTRLAFGRRLAALVGIKDVVLKAAHSLPPPKVASNAFAFSYMIDEASHTVYVHKLRLSSSGDFGLLLMHAFSHLKVHFVMTTIFTLLYMHYIVA